MYSKLAVFVAASMAVFVAAVPTATNINQCGNGSKVQCCNQSLDSDQSTALLALLDPAVLLGKVVAGVTGQVGVTCSPITALGVSGNSCNAQTVCCSNNSFNGVIALGCTPINVNL